MKGGQNLRDLMIKSLAKEENALPPCVCMVCGRSILGYYARFGNAGVCSSACMRIHSAKAVFGFNGTSPDDLERSHHERSTVDA